MRPRFLERFIQWYDKPVTHGDLLILAICLSLFQLVLWYPFLWLVWFKMS